jgi:hypothetical protein
MVQFVCQHAKGIAQMWMLGIILKSFIKLFLK